MSGKKVRRKEAQKAGYEWEESEKEGRPKGRI